MNYYESAEDYLERILMLTNQNGSVRSIDIAIDMNFSKASVSIAMKKLKEKGYILVDPQGYISLTDSGYQIANHILERHTIISQALIALGVSKEIALKDACKIEHVLSEETFQMIKSHLLSHKKDQ